VTNEEVIIEGSSRVSVMEEGAPKPTLEIEESSTSITPPESEGEPTPTVSAAEDVSATEAEAVSVPPEAESGAEETSATAEQADIAEARPAESAPKPVSTAKEAVAEQTAPEKPKRRKRRKRRKKNKAAIQVRVIPRKRIVKPLAVGMELHGTVKRIADFGAFVDIGVKQDGLVHVSRMAKKYVRNPLKVVAVGDVIDVKVVSVDIERGRISLSMVLDEGK